MSPDSATPGPGLRRESLPPYPHRNSRRRATSRLVGREDELTQVRVALHAAREGRGGMAFLVGEAGIGKTRLAEESADAALMFGFTGLGGRCGEGERDLPYAPIRRALCAPIGLCPPTEGAETRVVRRRAPCLLSCRNCALRWALLRLVHWVMPGAERLRLWAAVRTLLDFRRKPKSPYCTLILEDLHWADDATLGLLTYLARRERRRTRGSSSWVRLVTTCPTDHPLRALMLEGGRHGGVITMDMCRNCLRPK